MSENYELWKRTDILTDLYINNRLINRTTNPLCAEKYHKIDKT